MKNRISLKLYAITSHSLNQWIFQIFMTKICQVNHISLVLLSLFVVELFRSGNFETAAKIIKALAC